jgi:hypothetical protein
MLQTPHSTAYSSGVGVIRSMGCERNNRCAGELAAGVAFPVVTDFATFNEFGGDGSDHQVAAVWTTRGRGESAGGRELRPTFMKLHITASLSSRPRRCGTGASWQGRDGLMKV